MIRDEGRRGLGLHRSFGGFTAITLVPAVGMLVALVLVSRQATVAQWVGLGVGTSAGGVLALVVMYGWRLTGPVEVARAAPEGRQQLYAQSLADRAVVLVVALGPAVLIAWGLAPPGAKLVAITTTSAVALTGFTAVWYAVGVDDPMSCLRLEAVPRVVGVLVGGGVVAAGVSLWSFPVLMGAGNLLGALLMTWHVLPGRGGMVLASVRSVPASLRGQASAAATEITGGTYSAAAVALVGAVGSPAVTGAYVAGDRFYRAALIPVSSLSSSLQRRVSEASGPDFRHAVRRAVAAHAVLGIAGGLLVTVLGHDLTGLMFGDALAVPDKAAIGFGVSFAAVSLNTSLGRHVLASQGRVTAVLTGTAAGAVLGVPALLFGAARHGVVGASAGLALSEVVVLAVFAVACWTGPSGRRGPLRRGRDRSGGAGQSSPTENADSRSWRE